jgi:hypothetical protein
VPYKERIKKVAANFPGIMDSDRLELLNTQLIRLQKRGFTKIVDNFLSNKNQYTISPFLFEIYLCRWFLSQYKIKGIVYEPDDMARPPEFVFNIDDKSFQIEAKVITQLINETVKKKLVSQINRRISSKTKIVFEIWLSENIELKDINKIVDWICDERVSLTIGNKKELFIEEETVAWIKAIYERNSGGKVGIEHVLGTANGLAQQIDTTNIKEKIHSKIKKSNSKFKSRLGDEKSHKFAQDLCRYLFQFIDHLYKQGLSEKTVQMHLSNCWSIGILECGYGYRDEFFPGDIFYGLEADYEYEFKKKMSDSNYAIKSYRSTWKKLYKYTKSLGFIDNE